MSVSDLSGESLLCFYESIRKEVEAGRESMRCGSRHFFANNAAIKEYAENLRQEIVSRGLSYVPIVWL
jgi:hypothetical protein